LIEKIKADSEADKQELQKLLDESKAQNIQEVKMVEEMQQKM